MRKLLLLCSCAFLFLLAENAAQAQMVIYSNALVNGWENYSYNTTLNYANTSPVLSGAADSISATITSAYGAIVFYAAPMTDSSYTNISFWLNGGATGGQQLQLYGNLGTGPTTQTPRVSLAAPEANTWVEYTVSLSALGVANATDFSGFAIQDSAGTTESTFYLDNVQLNAPSPLTASAGGNQTICKDGGTSIGGSPTAGGGAGGYSYSWSPGTGLSSATVANPTASPTSTTTYTVTVTDSSKATAQSSVTVTVSPQEAATASAGANQTISAGSSTAGLGGSVGGGATGGIWTTSGSGSFAPSATTLDATYGPSAGDIAAGTVTLTLTTTGQLSPCGPATAQVVVNIQSAMVVYSNALVNGWENYSYNTTVNLANTSPVYGGSQNSISATITGAYGGFVAYIAPMSDVPYANISFWLNGGATGGQQLQMYGNVGTGPTTQSARYFLSAPAANTWTQYIVPLSALGVADVTDFSGFAIQDSAGTAEPTFYLDDIQLGNPAPTPTVTAITVNAGQSIRTADARWFGLNATIWDNDFGTSQTIALLKNMGIQALRFPGGSDSDDYHWLYNRQDENDWTWTTSLATYVQVITSLNAETMITLNYGTGTSNEAAAWVAYCNAATTSTQSLGVDSTGFNWQTAGYWASLRAAKPLATDDGKNFLRISKAAPLGFKYWEIGNEEYGSWETDSNSVPHDPYTYAVRASGYISLIKAVDPAAKVGVVTVPGTSSYVNNTSHPAMDPVTGQTYYGWTPVLLATLKSLGVTPDFAIYHNYPLNPGGESDATLLGASGPPSGWASTALSLRQMITDYLGSNGTNAELICTENNSVSSAPGKQTVSLVNSLYKLDSLAQLMQTEFNGLFWWALRNGQDTDGNMSSTLYGWREYGDYGVVNTADYTDPNLYPTYYTTELMENFVQTGDTVISASSTSSLLSAYAVRRQNGNLTMLVINKDPTNTLTGQISVAGFTPASGAVYSYGIPQDDAVENGSGSTGVALTNISVNGTNISYAFQPYSATVFVLSSGSLTASASAPATICSGGSAPIGGSPTATNGFPPYSYSWSPVTGLSSATAANPAASPASTTTYTLTVTDSSKATAQSSVLVTVNPSPAITLGDSPSLTYHSSTNANLPYSATSGSPDGYSITYDSTAQAAGFSNVPLTVLPASPITLTAPIAAGASTYNGALTLNNSSTGCVSANYAITVTVAPLPITLTGTRPSDGTTVANSSILTIVTNYDGTNLTLSGSATLAGAAAGLQTITNFSGLTLGGAAAANYTLVGASGSVTITSAVTSSFSITSSSVAATGTNFVVCWQSVPGVVYNVLTNTTLGPPQSWGVAAGPITATNTTTCFTLPGGIAKTNNVFVVIQQ